MKRKYLIISMILLMSLPYLLIGTHFLDVLDNYYGEKYIRLLGITVSVNLLKDLIFIVIIVIVIFNSIILLLVILEK